MAKTNRKESRKIYEGYKKRQRLWNTIFIVFFAVIGIGSAVLNGTMELDPQIVIGKYEFTWFHLVILAVLVVLLGFGIVALKRDSSEEQQEIYRQEREEAIRLRQEVMAERKQEMQDAYNAMKRRRAERQHSRCATRRKHSFQILIHHSVLRSCCKPHSGDKTMRNWIVLTYFTIFARQKKPSKSGKNIDSTRQKRYNKGNAMRTKR